jgi:Holliday junction DNA helicase RuvB
LIGATTRAGLIASPLRDRFGASYRLDFYTPDDIEKILSRSIKILNIDSDREGIAEIARRSRGTPRIANRILKRVRDYTQVKGSGVIDKKITMEALKMLEIDEMGLDSMDKKIMLTIINKFKGGPVGIETLGVAVSEEPGTIEDVYEPYLIQIGFIQRTQSGRKATQRAYEYFGIKMDKEGTLF